MDPNQQPYATQAPQAGMQGQPYPTSPVQAAPQLQGQPVAAPRSNPNSTQNTLQIAEIRDGIVIMNDGSYRAVVTEGESAVKRRYRRETPLRVKVEILERITFDVSPPQPVKPPG